MEGKKVQEVVTYQLTLSREELELLLTMTENYFQRCPISEEENVGPIVNTIENLLED